MKTKTKKKLTPVPVLLKKAEKIMNAFVRRRDSEEGFFTCISCAKTLPVVQMNAGHYVPVGKSSFLRFHEDNNNGECQGCNCFDSSHLIGYRKNLVKKIGLERVEWLEDNRHAPKKWSRFELEEIIKMYK